MATVATKKKKGRRKIPLWLQLLIIIGWLKFYIAAEKNKSLCVCVCVCVCVNFSDLFVRFVAFVFGKTPFK